MAKDSAWKKLNTDLFDEYLTKSFESRNKWTSLSKQETNHSSYNNPFTAKNHTSNNWVARGTKIESSWSSNRKEKDDHSYDCNANSKYSPYNNRTYHQNDRYSRHYNNDNGYQPRCSNNRSYQQNKLKY